MKKLMLSMLVASLCVGNMFAGNVWTPEQQAYVDSLPAADKTAFEALDDAAQLAQVTQNVKVAPAPKPVPAPGAPAAPKAGKCACLKNAWNCATGSTTAKVISGSVVVSVIALATAAVVFRKELKEKFCGNTEAQEEVVA